LLSIVALTTAEAVVIGCASVLVHSLRSQELREHPARILIAVAVQATVVATGGFVLNSLLPAPFDNVAVRSLAGAFCLFVANTLPVAIAVRLSASDRLGKVWKESYSWVLPYYLVCGALTFLIHRGADALSFEVALLVLPTIYLAYRYYRRRSVELEARENYANKTKALHLRAIEGLALAVEAKDNLNTRGHLRRVQVYSLAIGREMGLSESELEALHAGALLHDIGKLAVPDHILTKPGKLTREEFAKMKVHPVVGAEIVDQVQFPYPVAPIVRSHHERWDGSGYPYGLKGGEIPIGGRILSAVDCLDALTSDREYRKAMSLDAAMDYVDSEAGKSFDPEVVKILRRLHRSLAEDASLEAGQEAGLSVQPQIGNPTTPGAGLDTSAASGVASDVPGFLSAIAAANREEQHLRVLTGNIAVLELDELMPRIERLLQGLIPVDATVLFLRHANEFRAEYSTGVDADALAYLGVAAGEGLTGWVAQHRKAVVNGNPSVDPGFPAAASEDLRSALSTPLAGPDGLVGVLNLYRRDKDAFNGDELRVLNTVTPNIALALENALKMRDARLRAQIDPETGLATPELFRQTVAEEIARSRRTGQNLCVLFIEVKDLEKLTAQFGATRINERIAVLGKAVKRTCREYDSVARHGKAVFTASLPAMRPVDLRSLLDRLRALADGSDSDVVLDLNIGGSFYPEDGDGARHLLQLARHRAVDQRSDWTESINALAATLDRGKAEVKTGKNTRAAKA
jgi:putative nucleotidyltransferase with HDIG domain